MRLSLICPIEINFNIFHFRKWSVVWISCLALCFGAVLVMWPPCSSKLHNELLERMRQISLCKQTPCLVSFIAHVVAPIELLKTPAAKFE